MLSILDRTTLEESWQLLLIGILLIAGVFFATAEFAKILQLICDIGIDPSTALIITALQLPTTVVFSLPAGILLATGVSLWRRLVDYEILALAVSGIGTGRIFAPFVVAAFAATCLSFFLTDQIVPETRRLSNKLFLTGAINSSLPKGNSSLTFFKYDDGKDQRLKQILLAGRSLDKSIQNVIILDMTHTRQPNVIWAKNGFWKRGAWTLTDGHIYELIHEGTSGVNMTFQKLGIDAIGKLTEDFEKHGPLTNELTTAQLKQKIEAIEATGKPAPPDLVLRYLRRYSQSASCLLLIFAALPLCIATPRRRSYWALAYIGATVAGYFFLQQVSLSLGDNGQLPPVLAAWLPGAAAVIIGFTVYYYLRTRN